MIRSLTLCLTVFVLLSASAQAETPRDPATLVRMVDGDTLEVTLKGKTERVRLIGVDTPEKFDSEKLDRDVQRTKQDRATIKALGDRASGYASTLVQPGATVQLEYGPQRRDRYKRLLAFVWLNDGHMLNEILICDGYANALTRYPFRKDYQTRFRTCEQQARAGGKGLWVRQASVTTPARSGCCSHHGGVCGCEGNRAKCCDGTLSPSCGC